ncbi:hypothetical protein D3C71_616790 [compost metagenome]
MAAGQRYRACRRRHGVGQELGAWDLGIGFVVSGYTANMESLPAARSSAGLAGGMCSNLTCRDAGNIAHRGWM